MAGSAKPVPSLPPALVTRIETALKALYPDARVVVRVEKSTGPGSRSRPLEVFIRAELPPANAWSRGSVEHVAGGYSFDRLTARDIDEAARDAAKRLEWWLQKQADEAPKRAAQLREEAQETLRQAEREDVRARDVREALMAFSLSGVSVGEIGR